MVFIKNEEEDNRFLAKEISRKICSEHKMNCIVLTTGKMGSGKSYAMMRLAEQISEEISKTLKDEPEDHFTMKNVGIMTATEIERVFEMMDSMTRNIFILDDIGAFLNARKFTSAINISHNDRLQTARPRMNVIIYSVPNQMLTDKVLRMLASYIVYMQPPEFDTIGCSVADIRAIDVRPDGQIWYPRLKNWRGETYYKYLFSAPRKEWTIEYDKRREIANNELLAQCRATVEESIAKKVPQQTKKDIALKLHDEMMEGKFGDMSYVAICRANNLSPEYAQKVVSIDRRV